MTTNNDDLDSYEIEEILDATSEANTVIELPVSWDDPDAE